VQASVLPPPTRWLVKIGACEWIELDADDSTLQMSYSQFLMLLLAHPLLGPVAKTLEPPLVSCKLLVFKRILAADRLTPNEDDDVDGNVANITSGVAVGGAAAQRQTGENVFIFVRPPAVPRTSGEH